MKIILVVMLLFLWTRGVSQSIQIDRETIIDRKISKVLLKVNAIKALQAYDGLIIGEHIYNDNGFKTYEKLIYPWQDVVATVSQNYYFYNDDTLINKELNIENAVKLSERDESYINAFGIDYDTTTTIYKYNKIGLLKSKINFSNFSKDTIINNYFYNKSNELEKLTQSNTSYPNRLYADNFTELYYYSSDGLLDSIEHYPLGFNNHSTEIYKYDKNDNLIEKKKINGFAFTTIVKYDKEDEIEIEQDINKGSIEKHIYNENNLVIKSEIGYYSPNQIDRIKYYKYNEQGKVIEFSSENHSKAIIVLVGHLRYRYDKNGILIAEEILLNDEVQFEYLIEYEQ